MKVKVILKEWDRDVLLDFVNLSRDETKNCIKNTNRQLKDLKEYLKAMNRIKQALRDAEKVRSFAWLLFWRHPTLSSYAQRATEGLKKLRNGGGDPASPKAMPGQETKRLKAISGPGGDGDPASPKGSAETRRQ